MDARVPIVSFYDVLSISIEILSATIWCKIIEVTIILSNLQYVN